MGQTDVNSDSHETNVKPVRFLCSMRCAVAVLSAIGLAVQYSQRVNLTMGIVCMTNKTALKMIAAQQASTTPVINNISMLTMLPSFTKKSTEKIFKDGPFIWNRSVQGRILSSYFFGYIAFQVGGGILAYKFGAFIVFFIAMLGGSVFSFLIPVTAPHGYVGVIILRVLTGLLASIVWPTLVELMSQWSPKSEKSTMLAIGNSGAQLGPILTLPISGLLCASSVLGGWPLLFYVTGGAGIVWCILWVIFVRSSPANHKFMNKAEKAYILKDKKPETNKSKKQKIPLKEIFCSVPCLALFACHFFKAFPFYTLLTNISTYYEEILGINLKSSGFLSAVPYLCYWIFTIASGRVADALLNRKIMKTTFCRKLFTGLGTFVPAVFFYVLGYIDKRKPWVGVLLLTLILIFQGCNTGGGMYVIVADMAPQFAGILWGISNSFGTAPGIIIPLVIGAITKKGLIKEWRIVFTICCVSNILSGLVFVLFASAERQPFAKEEIDKEEAKEMLEVVNSEKKNEEKV